MPQATGSNIATSSLGSHKTDTHEILIHNFRRRTYARTGTNFGRSFPPRRRFSVTHFVRPNSEGISAAQQQEPRHSDILSNAHELSPIARQRANNSNASSNALKLAVAFPCCEANALGYIGRQTRNPYHRGEATEYSQIVVFLCV